MSEIKSYPPTEECKKCGGYCCKHMGCHFSPEDFPEISFDYLKAEIEKGSISIDWWDGDYGPEYLLRMRNKNCPIVDPSWGGECILLTDTGCPLTFDQRPLGARALEPNLNGRCEQHYSKEMCKNNWLPYYDILSELREYFD